MDLGEAIAVTRERRDYLSERIKAKETVGWDTVYDRRERDAHTVLLAACANLRDSGMRQPGELGDGPQ